MKHSLRSLFGLGLFAFTLNAQQPIPNPISRPYQAVKSIGNLPALEQKAVAPPKERGHGLHNNACATHDLTQKYYESIGKWGEFNQTYLEEAAKTKPYKPEKTPGVNTIAVIFHVVHNPNNPAENVSNALIMQVFNDLQEDFQLLNQDAANARTNFGFIPADVNISFCLATKDPAGVPLAEQGVVRVSTNEDYYNHNGVKRIR